ncbi:nucleotidyltransferase family protein [Lysobacter niabensis]|uniref:nucleotidyltransferase family protein n=1 Tax=Agrilutibacter niabensis TaxID=380628 RepID=UPI00360E97D1
MTGLATDGLHRSWLAGLLRENAPADPQHAAETEEFLAAAEREGVSALVAERLRNSPDDGIRSAFADRARGMAAASMLRYAECQRVFGLLETAGIRCLLLKGSALGWWLYPSPHLRETADFDLLFETVVHARQAAELLQAHGYTGGEYFGPMAHEVTVRRSTSAMTMDLDLHWRLFNSPLFAEALPNCDLFASSISIPAFHQGARGLGPAHATVHACLHRVMNLHMGAGDRLKWLYDLHLLAGCLSSQAWDQLLEICSAHRVSVFCLDAVRATTETLGTEFPERVLRELERLAEREDIDPRQFGNWRYMQRLGVSRIPTFAGRMRWFLHKVFPSPAYLRSFYGTDMTWTQLLIERMRRLVSRIR